MSDRVRHAACRCGQVRVACTGEPIRVSVCHCRQCKVRSGSAFAAQVRFPAEQVRIEGEANAKMWQYTGASGNTADFFFCGTCGSPILSDLPSQQGLHFIKAGTLDDVTALDPKMHFWTASAQPWVRYADDAVKFDKTPG